MGGDPFVRLDLVKGMPEEIAVLQRVFEDCPGYFERVYGSPCGPAEAVSTCAELPEGRSFDDKCVFLVMADDEPVGCVDLVRGFPDAATAMLGLLLIAEPCQRRGVGSASYRCVEDAARAWPECERVRIGVVRTNARVLPFWHRMGFAETGESRPYVCGPVTSDVVVLEKALR